MKLMIYYALERDALSTWVDCAEGATLREVLELAKSQLPDFLIDDAHFSSFGVKLALEDVMNASMRIEIVRPLIITPTEARRLRAQRGLTNRNSLRAARKANKNNNAEI